MTFAPFEKSIIISTLFLLIACGKNDHKDHPAPAPVPVPAPAPAPAPAPTSPVSVGNSGSQDDSTPQVKLVNLIGSVDNDLQGTWVAPCQNLGQGSRRLTYRFEPKSLIIEEALDLVRSSCDNPALVTSYRFELQPGTWRSDQSVTRTVKGKFAQVIMRTKSDQLTQYFNRDFQCGVTDWKTNTDHDITGLSCLGINYRYDLQIPLTDPVEFSLNVHFKDNSIYLNTLDEGQSYSSALNQLFQVDQKVDVSDGRDVGAKYWNNEIPDVGTVTVETKIQLTGFPNMKGSKDWWYTVEPHVRRTFSIQDGVMTIGVVVPKTITSRDIPFLAIGFHDTLSNRDINLSYVASSKSLEFSDSGTVVGRITGVEPIVLHVVNNSGVVDTTAPSFAFKALSGALTMNNDIEVTFSAKDDLSGIRMLFLEFDESFMRDTPTNRSIEASRIIYEGRGNYRAIFQLANYNKVFVFKKITGARVLDRAGNWSEMVSLNYTFVN